ncbi:MAG: hypothetical protein ACSHWU_11655, partial [Marinicella sp.]
VKEGLHIQYAYAQSEGKYESTGLLQNTVQPESLVVGVGYDSPSGRLGTKFIMTVNDRNTENDDLAIHPNDLPVPTVQASQSPGYRAYDWIGYWNVRENGK